jgi:branched-chain amino acid transport system permease protein
MRSVTAPAAPAPAETAARVTRSRRPAGWLSLVAVAVVAVFAYLPYVVYSGTTDLLVNVFILLTVASMWNLLAGYAGLVSVGQQAFIGLGAYFVLILAQHGTNPFAALPIAAVMCGAAGLVIWWLVSRLRGGYFAIATWVVAATCEQVISRFQSLGGGTGAPLPGLSGLSGTLLTAYTYWIALAVTVVTLATVYLIMRGRLGLVLTAVRDDEVGARSIGARVWRTRQFVFVVAAIGCGAAGGLIIISQLNVQPSSAFSVQWSAEMIFATLIGGIGTIEGPILGTAVFFVLQQNLSQYNAWYLIILGLVAIAVALWAPRGLWGTFADYTHIRLFPVRYWLWPPGQGPARRHRLGGLLRVRGHGDHAGGAGPRDVTGADRQADRVAGPGRADPAANPGRADPAVGSGQADSTAGAGRESQDAVGGSAQDPPG